MTKLRTRRLVAIVSVAVAVVVPVETAAAADPVVGAAGDIACDPTDAAYNGGAGTATACRQRYTSDILVDPSFSAVIALGDNQYNSGSLSNYNASYNPSWGRVKAKTHPAIGNHEGTSATSGRGYCSYFGAAVAHCSSAGDQSGAAFYSWDIGTWHVVALNSNCTAAGGCDVGSAQYSWLSRDLAASSTKCTLAYWHHPRYSSGSEGSAPNMQPIWKLLYDSGADLVLSGHNHSYERFAPMDGNGLLNRANGMREFVVGTGGAFFTGLGTRIANSEIAQNRTFGVLKLTLHPTSYDYTFMPAGGQLFTESGTDNCRGPGGATGDTSAPTTPGTPTVTAKTTSTVDLAWTASSDNVAVTGYRVFRNGAQVGTTAGSATTFSDSGLTASTTFSYTVQAIDAADNASPQSGAVSVTTSASGGGTTLTFAPTDDATIDAAAPTTATGTGTRLTVDGSPVNDTLLKFTVSGTGAGTTCPSISTAKLRMTVGNGTSDNSARGGDFRGAVDSGWTESTVTYRTAPAAVAGPPVASITTAVALSTAYLVDVTPLVNGNGTFTIRAGNTSSDGARYYSHDGNSPTVAPQLQIACGTASGGGTDTTAPSTPGTPTVTGTTTTSVSLTWQASTDTVGVTGYRILRGGVQVGTSSGTTFTESGLTPGTSYGPYTVQALDAAGNASAASGSVSATTASAGGGATTLTFAPSDDATIDASAPTTPTGTANRITVDSSPVNAMLLKFTVLGTGPGTTCARISSAKLRLTVGNSTSDNSTMGGVFSAAAANPSWSESTVTYDTAPAAVGAPVASITTPVALSTAYLVDVTPIITGDGTFTIRATGNSSDGARYYSRNGNAATLAPELQITCG